jgi:uncharacterized iron-regulated membrane protein
VAPPREGGRAAGSGQRNAAEREGRDAAAERPQPPVASLDALVRQSAQRYPEWRTLTVTVPASRDTSASIAIAEGNTFRPDLRTTLILSTGTASVLAVRDYASLSPARKIRAWTRFGHTGEVFGVTGQVIATLVSAVGVLLVWTGIALAWRRFMAWVRRRSRVPALQPSPGD